MSDEQHSLCLQLCTPCILAGLRQITKWDWDDVRSMTAASPTSWSALVRHIAEACARRRTAGPQADGLLVVYTSTDPSAAAGTWEHWNEWPSQWQGRLVCVSQRPQAVCTCGRYRLVWDAQEDAPCAAS